MQLKRVGAGLAIVCAVATVYFRFLRPWHLNWGATAEEARGEVAGDELMPQPDVQLARVVEIDAVVGGLAVAGADGTRTRRRVHLRLDTAHARARHAQC